MLHFSAAKSYKGIDIKNLHPTIPAIIRSLKVIDSGVARK